MYLMLDFGWIMFGIFLFMLVKFFYFFIYYMSMFFFLEIMINVSLIDFLNVLYVMLVEEFRIFYENVLEMLEKIEVFWEE